MNTNKLLGVMAEKRISQAQLAKLLGKSKNTINAKINGKGTFDTQEATTICDVLGITDKVLRAEIFLSEASQN